MSNQADGITTTEPLHDPNRPAEGKQGKLAKENAVALSAAENEGLPVVGLGDEKAAPSDPGNVIEITPATEEDLIPVTDISDIKRKRA